MRRYLTCLPLLLLALSGCDACSSPPAPPAASPPDAPAAPEPNTLATVDGEPITRSEVEDDLTAALELRARMGQPPGPRWLERKRQQLLEARIERLLLERGVADAGIKVTDEEVDARVQAEIEAVYKTERGLDRHLERTGRSREDLRRELRDELAVDRLIGADAIEVTEEDVRRFYQSRAERMKAPARVELATILIRLPTSATPDERRQRRTRARTVARLARQPGASFEELARAHSESPTRARGGRAGWATLEDLDEALAIPAFRLAVGAVSDPIETPSGLQVIKVLDRKEAGVTPLDEVRPRLEAQLRRRRRAQRRARTLAELRERYPVVVTPR